MGRAILRGGRIFTGRAFVDGGAALIDGSRIKAVYDRSDQCAARPDDDVRDIDGMIAAPGFVDIHIHGAMGCDAMNGTYDAIDTIARAVASRGTTSFLVTTTTASIDDTYHAIVAAGRAMKRGTSGAQVLGVHMEGPFINTVHKGAQMASFILPPSMDAYRSMTGEYGYIVKRVTLAPEMEGALQISRYLHKNSILVSAGHTGASYDEMRRAYDAGVTHATHLFNGMNPIHHREPGVPGTALTQDGWTVEVIADTVHLHPAILKMAWLCKGADRCALVSDAMEATLMGDGVYELGGQKVIVRDGQARLEAGNLAGSTLTLDKAVKNMVEAAGIPLADALKMASLTPARLIGADGHKGRIEQGYDADVVLLDEADLSVKGVMIAGKWH